METQRMQPLTGQASDLFVGIDVSKAALDIALRPSGEAWRCANADADLAQLVAQLPARGPHLVVLEATGGLERWVVAALAVAGVPVAVVNPRQARDFAKATGHLAKTAAVDAAVLAHCAQAIGPTPRPLPAAQSQILAALVERRHPLVAIRTAEHNRLQTVLAAVRPHVQAHLAWLDQALQALDSELDQTLHASPRWREREQLLRRVPGSGPVVALPLIAELPELGQGALKHVATLVGVAPRNRARGKWRGTRAVWGGRQHVRDTLYRAALVGVRHHPVLRAFYERLLARAKPKKLALTACMHKLLIILPAVLRDRTPWQPTLLAT